MIQSKETKIVQINTPLIHETTKDAGRVRIGGGMIHFADEAPAHEVTKDAGRVRIGGGMIQF